MHGGTPIAIVVLSVVILHEKITRGEIVGIVLALAGVMTIVLKGDPSRLLQIDFNTGDILVLMSMFSWALYTVLLKWLPDGVGGSAFIFTLMALAVVMLAPLYGWDLVAGRRFVPNLENVALILYTALFSSVLAYLFWNRGVAAVGAKAAGFTNYLIPVVGLVGSLTILGEETHPHHIFAIVLIFSGLYLATRSRGHG
jgi:drug/metabolite transporter (DMT)-like permease